MITGGAIAVVAGGTIAVNTGGTIGPMGVMKLGVRHGVRPFLEHFLAS